MIDRMMASFVLGMLIIAVIVTESKMYDIDDAEIDQLLRRLNKPAIKSIKSPDGDIIDCVHMKNHPIYDHPLFKNHTIQMRPSFFPKSSNTEKKSSMVTQLWRTKGRCPKNSIPIRRTRREDILRAESIEKYGKKNPNSFPHLKPANSTRLRSTHVHSILGTRGRFHGAKAIINAWKPHVQTSKEFSLAQIWVVAGPSFSETNSIEAGWHVYENHYGNDTPRYFTYWTADGYRTTGCYNTICSGFVALNQDFALGAAVSPTSSVNGEQYQIPTSIWKDPRSGHWWLKFYNDLIGYWPSFLFNHLQTCATNVQWGGEITDYKDGSQHTTTNMGSGHFAEEGYQKASYFRNLEIVDEGEIMRAPVGTFTFMAEASCYNLKPSTDVHWGLYFFFGGPGRNPNCP